MTLRIVSSGFPSRRAGLTVAICVSLAGCSVDSGTTAKVDPVLGVAASPRVVAEGEAVPEGGGRYQVGKPYQVAGEWYEPKEDPGYDREGVASWYGAAFHGRLTANGEVFDSADLSAAHPTLPLPSYVRVTNLENDRSVIVRVNDRGPFAKDRLIDVSERTAQLLDFRHDGMTRVRVKYVDRARLDGEDEAILLASYEGPAASDPASGDVMIAAAPASARPIRPAATPVVLASARPAPAESAAPAMQQPMVAFAGGSGEAEGGAGGAVAAAETLAASHPADERIAIAFQLIAELEQ